MASVVEHNRATWRGGGFYAESGNNLRKGIGCLGAKQVVRLERTKVHSNFAESQGGGIYLWNAAVEADAASTVAFNHAGDGGGVALVGAFSNFNNSDTGSDNGAESVNFTGVYGNMASASGTPDVSARNRVGMWWGFSGGSLKLG